MVKTRRRIAIGISTVLIAALIGGLAWNYLGQPQKTTQHGANSSPTVVKLNEQYLTIPEWGVRIRVTEEIKNISYFRPINAVVDGFSFTTDELSTAEPRCSGKDRLFPIPTGLLSRASKQEMGMGQVIAHIDGFYYQYRSSDAACSIGDTNLELKVVTAISKAVLTLEKQP